MELKRVSTSSFLLRFKIGEELVQGLLNFAKKKKLKSAWLSGLGGFQVCTLGFYDLKRKTYRKKNVKNVELTSLTGNISFLKGKYALHTHVTVSDKTFRAFGGHLFKGIVSGTCEIFVKEIPKLNRKFDKKTGLNLLEL